MKHFDARRSARRPAGIAPEAFAALSTLATLASLAASPALAQTAVQPGPALAALPPTASPPAQPFATNNVKGIDIIVRKKPGGATKLARLDGNGRFNLGPLEPGDYTLTVSPEALRQATSGGQTVEIEITGAAPLGKVDLRRAAQGGIDFSVKALGVVGGQASRAVSTIGVSGR
jgi:hypothetical protein